MVSSKKLSKNNVSKQHDTVEKQLKLFLEALFHSHNHSNPTLLVAFSGGVDSAVLLYLLCQLQKEVSFHLKAMYVNHGLSQRAGEWAVFCQEVCHELGVPINVVSVKVDKKSGLGIEAAARHARYDVLNKAEADYICLGHHQDDQAETFLLQLARGAGVKGLASMSKIDSQRRLLRPLLNTKRSALIEYAMQHQIQWIEDESNADVEFDRNFIRHTLIPTFNQRYKDIASLVARSAAHMGEANQLLDELAMVDANLILDEMHPFGLLRLDALFKLSRARQGNFIRWWLAKNEVGMPTKAVLNQILEQLQSKKTDATIKVKVSEHLTIMRYQGRAYLVQETKQSANINRLWQGEESLLLPDQSRLSFTKKLGEGFAYERGGRVIQLRIKNREGGEYFKPVLGRPRRRLKTIMQNSAIPPWQREQLPLIFMDETLVMIPNIGVNAEMKASEREVGLTATWEPYSQ